MTTTLIICLDQAEKMVLDQAGKVLGVTLWERWTIPAQKAGFTRFGICLNQDLENDSLSNLKCADLLTGLPFTEADLLPGAFILRPDVLIALPLWQKLAQTKLTPGQGFQLPFTRSYFFRPQTIGSVLGPRAGCPQLDLPETQGEWIVLDSGRGFVRARQWLLQGLIKKEEGFMSRHFERKLSIACTKVLVTTSLTPNHMTLISTAIGVGGSFFFLSHGAGHHLIGALLFWLHSILDGCDGEIARLKFQQSRAGGILDFWGDNVVHSFVFGMISWGLAHRIGRSYPYGLGLLAVGGTLLSAAWVYWRTMREKSGTGPVFSSVAAQPGGKMQKVADALARRDFIYLVILLAALGKIHLFLWMSAIGSPLYFLVLVFL